MKKVVPEKVYRIEGDYIESCNCATVCPCLLNGVANNAVPATEGHCDLLLGYTIKKGHYKDVDLSGLNFALGIYSGGPLMSVPNWSVAYYIDDRATDEQFESLEKIITGEAGGCPVGIKNLREVLLGCTRAKIDIVVTEKHREVTVGEVGHVILDAVTGLSTPGDEGEVLLGNCHPQTQNGDVILANARQMFYKDYGFNFVNTGKSAIYGYYIWQENYEAGVPA